MKRDGTEGNDKKHRKQNGKVGKGYYNVDLEDTDLFEMNSRILPLIDEKNGYIVLGRSSSAHKKWSKKGLLEVGAVGEHQSVGDDLCCRKVFIDAAFPHILFICGKRGSGKSYTLGIFAEELIRSSIGVGVILVDPIGIFWSLKMENQSKFERDRLKNWELSPTSFPEVRVLAPGMEDDDLPTNCDDHFSIAVSEMTPEDWCQLFDMDRFKTQGLLIGTAVDFVLKGYEALVDDVEVNIPPKENNYSIGDLIQCIETSIVLTSKGGGFNSQTRRSVIARFQAASSWGLFSAEGTPLKEMTSPNRATVLDISDPNIGDAKRSLLTGIIARKILEGRIYSARVEESGETDDSDHDTIPLTWLLIDEAHIILPHGKQTAATKALIEYAKQGRRPGCALVLATQRPASTSDEILSQVDILIGHNLALEDDMKALRRRVPAKLPPEYASSDFIRGIPVGTGIIADQRTQQRSFVLKFRPRLSHHAGSSAMPKAFMDKGKKKKLPITGTYSKDSGKKVIDEQLSGPSVKSKEVIKKKEKIEVEPEKSSVHGEFPLENIPWGSTLLVKGEDRRSIEKLVGKVKDPAGLLLFSRAHPSDCSMPDGINQRKTFWLSSTPSEGTIPPKNLQDISMETEAAVSGKENWIIVIEGIEYLFHNNGLENVQRLLEILHEKVYLGKHILIIRADSTMENRYIETLSMEMDHVIGEEHPKDDDVIGTKEVVSDPNGSLSNGDLEWMCDIMGISTQGTESELLDRIVQHELEMAPDTDRFFSGSNHTGFIKEMIRESAGVRDENEKLRKRIDELSSLLKKGKKEKEKRLVIEWEGSEGEDRFKELLDEITSLRERMDDLSLDAAEGQTQDIMEKIIEKIEVERKNNLDKLKELEEVFYDEIGSIKERVEVDVEKKIAAPGPETKEKTGVKRKKRVVKEKPPLPVVPPKVGLKVVMGNAKKRLKRSLFKGPREAVDDIRPFYMPLHRILVSFKTALGRNTKDSDIYIDALTGELVTQGRGGLRRSRGIHEMRKATSLEMRVIRILQGSKKDEITISRKMDRDVSSTKRILASMAKKGLIEKYSDQGGASAYGLSSSFDITRRPWSKDAGFRPEEVKGLKEEMLEPLISAKEAISLLRIYGDAITILDNDLIYYPVYVASIKGEGRTRFLFLDGVSGNVDEVLSDNAKMILKAHFKDKQGKGSRK